MSLPWILSRKYVLLGGFAAFVAWGLAIQRLPVLRFIGYAFVFGSTMTVAVALFAILTVSRSREQWLNGTSDATSIPSFLDLTKWQQETSRHTSTMQYQQSQLFDQSFVVSQSLNGLLNLATRDFVSSWYRDISSSPRFVNEVDRSIRTALSELKERTLREDVVNVVVIAVVC